MSQAGTSQFQEAIRQELEYSMKVELDKILSTAPSNELQVRSVMSRSHAFDASQSMRD